MTTDAFDTMTRAAGTERRTLLTLAAAGLAATLARPVGASARSKAGKKARKKCKQQKASCTDQVTAFCAQPGVITAECLALTLPCCAECDVAFGVLCTLNAFKPA